MTDLIARIESADGPSRELFMQAYVACFPELRFSGHSHRFMAMLDAKAWTSAAEMLVPEGWFWTMDSKREEWTAGIWRGREWAVYPHSGKLASTPALALAAAALKARGV